MPVKNQIQFLSLVAKELPDPFLGIHLAEGIELREIAFTRCPLYSRKRTSLSAIAISALYQKQTLSASFDHLVGAGNKVLWQGKTDCSGGSEID